MVYIIKKRDLLSPTVIAKESIKILIENLNFKKTIVLDKNGNPYKIPNQDKPRIRGETQV